jgi:hypothetical protein
MANNREVYVRDFHHIDFWQGGITDSEILADLVEQGMLACTEENACKAFLHAGWEGDGKLLAIWIPPFMFVDPDTIGVHIWYVKQNNNGTSWLCAEFPYSFPGLGNSVLVKNWMKIEVTAPAPKLPF